MSAPVYVFLYPEELEHLTAETLADEVRSLDVDGVSVAVAYHRSRRVLPRHRSISVLTDSTVYITPDRGRYGALAPSHTASPHLIARLLRFREVCERVGLGFRAWMVGLHHEHLAAGHPAAAARLLDGSPAGHSLCPSAAAARTYVATLAGEIAAQLGPEAIDLEAALYPAWDPAYTLTLALEPLSERARLLGSQCFCPSCESILGLDAIGIEERTRAAAGPPFADRQRADDRIVGELARARREGVRLLVEAVSDAVRPNLSRLRVFVSGSTEQAAIQGASPEALAAGDELLFGCGALTGAALTDRFAELVALTDRRGAVSINWTPERSPGFADDAARLAVAGASGLALYNLSLVPGSATKDFRAATAAFRSGAAG